uniref:Uncharacterized protein LOC100183262 n=1 Tax=Phallusia mammillata TaxID=59560 RepID=A0A6F9DI18_9ASCI|nr:uncharacterized protein LOC100183262 [Phallusia mammillata]
MELRRGHGEVGSDFNRHDLNLTSTGRGHYYSKGYYFPPSNFRRTINDHLPPPLTAQDKVTPNDQVINHYDTTSGTQHNYKHIGGVLSHPMYKKSPGSWKVHYVKDNTEKLKVREWRTPLTMGYQSSEMKAKYTGKPGMTLDTNFKAGPQPFVLSQHHKTGPSQKIIASTQNKAMSAKPFFVRDKGILNLNDVYLSSSQKAYRSFKREELLDYPQKNASTYWECEEYPKAWGHGAKENPLPKDSVPRERPPLRDPTWFPSSTKIPRLPKPMVPVPNKGLTTLVTESYQKPSDVKVKEIFSCPIDTPWVIAKPGPKEIMTIPKMYKTEYMTYGGGRPVTVT